MIRRLLRQTVNMERLRIVESNRKLLSNVKGHSRKIGNWDRLGWYYECDLQQRINFEGFA